MKTVTNLLTSLLIAAWIAAIALLSIQNVAPVSLRFLNWESIELPFGVLLAFSVGIGIIGAAILPLLWRLSGQSQESLPPEEYLEYPEPDSREY